MAHNRSRHAATRRAQAHRRYVAQHTVFRPAATPKPANRAAPYRLVAAQLDALKRAVGLQ